MAVSIGLSMVLDAKRITKEFLESEIADVKYTRLSDRTTHCMIITHSGAEFTGESMIADSSNFDEKKKKKYAFQQAFESMYEPYGFWLRQMLYYQNKSEEPNN
mgnify:CR=1 FL=1